MSSTLEPFDLLESVLSAPPDRVIRGAWRSGAAKVLDRELLVLAGAEQHARLAQARLTLRMMEIRGWQDLGFVRQADYARERLGMSPRTLEEDARVLRRLAQLPLLDDAARSGLLSWTRLRLLVSVATVQDQAVLLSAALERTTRQLQDYLERRAQPLAEGDSADSPAPSDRGACSQGSCDASGSGDGDRDGAPPIHADEAKVPALGDGDAEADPELRWNVTVSLQGRRLWRAACELASRSAGSPLSQAQVLELVCAETLAGPDRRHDRDHGMPAAEDIEEHLLERRRGREAREVRHLEAFRAETGVVDGFDWLSASEFEPGPSRMLDGLLEGLDAADAFELDRRLRRVRQAMQRVDAQIATLLRIGADRRLFRELGFASVKLYVESRLGISARKAWGLIAIERASRRSCPALREAWRLGQISSLAASALLPVISEKHGRAWIERAREVTLRRLHDEVAWALDHGDRHPALERPAPPPVDSDVRAETCADITTDQVQMRAYGPTPNGVCLGPPGAVRLTFRLPLSVATLAETALWLQRRPAEPTWRTFERITALAVLEWSSAPRHRDPVFARDGWRCAVPACSSRRNLHDHHVLYRSRGGANARDNRVTICAAHHLHGIHGGIVRARGRAPGKISWELGCRRGKEPLMRLRGDRYERCSDRPGGP